MAREHAYDVKALAAYPCGKEQSRRTRLSRPITVLTAACSVGGPK